MTVYSIGGVPVRDAFGILMQPQDPTAPNDIDFGGTFERIPDDPASSSAMWLRGISVPASGVDSIAIVLRGLEQGTLAGLSRTFQIAIPAEIKGAGPSDLFLGTAQEVLGRLLGASDITGSLHAVSVKMGTAFTTHPLIDDVDVPDPGVEVTVTAAPVILTAAEDLDELASFTFSEVVTEGDDPHVVYTFWTNDTADYDTPTQNTALDAATKLPAAATGPYFYVEARVWGFGVEEATPIISRSAVVEILEVVPDLQPPPQASDTQWRVPIGIAVSTPWADGFRVASVELDPALGAVEVEITTQLTGTDDELQWQAQQMGGTNGGFRVWDTVPPWTGGDGTDYSIFSFTGRAGDADRAGRIRMRYRKVAGGAWSPSTVAKRCESPAVVVTSGLHQQVVLRSKEQHDARARGGGGYQLPRGLGYSPAKPNRVIVFIDVTPPVMTESFGDLWERKAYTGLIAGRAGEGAHIDSQNGDRILLQHTGASQRGQAPNGNVWDTVSGVYLSLDGGQNFTLAQAMDFLAGTGEKGSGSRFVKNSFCEVPGGNALGTNRKMYCFHRRWPKNATNAIHTQIWRSLDGGASWHKSASGWTGPALAPGTYGANFRFLKRKSSTGWYYIGSEDGLFISKDECQSWTKLNAPTGVVEDIDLGGAAGEVWICVGGNTRGLYKHTNNGEGAVGTWTQKLTGADYHNFDISPHDRDLIVAVGNNQVTPKRTFNGGTNWTAIPCVPYPGQPGGFEHQVWGDHAQVLFHATDPAKLIGLAKQHFMICRDVNNPAVDGQGVPKSKFVFGSSGFDSFDVQCAVEDPAGTGDMLFNVTDRLVVYSKEAVWVTDSTNDNTFEDNVATITGNAGGHVGQSGGAVYLRSPDGTKQAKIAVCGVSQVNSGAPVRFTTGDGNPIKTGTAISGIGPYNTKGNGSAVRRALPSVGCLGRWKVTLGNNDALTWVNCGIDVFGFDAQGRVYGVALSGSTIRRDNGSGTFSDFHTCNTQPAPYDGSPWFEVDQNHDNRLIYPDNNGRLHRVTGAPGSQTRVQIFDLRNYVTGMPAAWDWELFRCRIDSAPARATVAYVSAFIYGKPCLWRTLDFTAGTVVWEDITGNILRMPTGINVMLDGSVIFGALGGDTIINKPGAAEASLFAKVKTYNAQIIAP